MNGTVLRVCANVKHWRDAVMALCWSWTAKLEAAKGFHRLKTHRQLRILEAALTIQAARHAVRPDIERGAVAV